MHTSMVAMVEKKVAETIRKQKTASINGSSQLVSQGQVGDSAWQCGS